MMHSKSRLMKTLDILYQSGCNVSKDAVSTDKCLEHFFRDSSTFA